jgi:hypothetical protein
MRPRLLSQDRGGTGKLATGMIDGRRDQILT